MPVAVTEKVALWPAFLTSDTGCVVIAGGVQDALMTNVFAALPVQAPASVAVIVNEKLPDCVGVPVNAPVIALSVSPGGSAPAVTLKVTGATPPVCVNVWL